MGATQTADSPAGKEVLQQAMGKLQDLPDHEEGCNRMRTYKGCSHCRSILRHSTGSMHRHRNSLQMHQWHFCLQNLDMAPFTVLPPAHVRLNHTCVAFCIWRHVFYKTSFSLQSPELCLLARHLQLACYDCESG